MKLIEQERLLTETISIDKPNSANFRFWASYTASLMDFMRSCWPEIIERNGCYLLGDVKTADMTEMLHILSNNKTSIETQLNRRRLIDMLPANGPTRPADLIQLGEMIQEMLQLKLKANFPHLSFSVIFSQGKQGSDIENFEITFFQNNHRPQ